MKRKIININEEKCDGCGACVPECYEGALQVIDGKVRLISDLFCDGLGACLGYCPQGALTIEEREAEPYNETKVMEYIVSGGRNVIKAHLEHLRDHNETGYFNEAVNYLNERGIEIPPLKEAASKSHSHCPGSQEVSFEENEEREEAGIRQSHLTHWPVQMHLISPMASHYRGSHLLLAADCCAFSYGDFHKDFLKGKSLAIACPKLDSNKQVYLEKLTAMARDAGLKSITVLIMQVPCCGGLFQMTQQALADSGKDIPLEVIVLGVNGEILKSVRVN